MFITTCQKNYRSVSVCTMHEERGDFYTVFYYEPPAPSAGHSLLLSTPGVLQLLLMLFSSHTTGVECKTVHTFLSWICSNCIVSQKRPPIFFWMGCSWFRTSYLKRGSCSGHGAVTEYSRKKRLHRSSDYTSTDRTIWQRFCTCLATNQVATWKKDGVGLAVHAYFARPRFPQFAVLLQLWCCLICCPFRVRSFSNRYRGRHTRRCAFVWNMHTHHVNLRDQPRSIP